MNPESTGATGPVLINMNQRLSTIALYSISMNLCLAYWKSQGTSRASRLFESSALTISLFTNHCTHFCAPTFLCSCSCLKICQIFQSL